MEKKYLFRLVQFIAMVGFIVFFIGNNITAAKNDMDINTMAKAVGTHKGSIIEWSLYTRERVHLQTKEEWLNKKQQLEKQFPDMHWTISFDKGAASVNGILNHRDFSEIIKIISTDKKRQSASYLIYEARGTRWNEEIAEQSNKLAMNRVDLLFDVRPVIFSCIKGQFNEELDEFINDSLDGFLHSLQVEERNSFKERGFYYISAYSSLFEQTLSFSNQKINMQVGLRKNGLGPGTSFVIGTPILTIEY